VFQRRQQAAGSKTSGRDARREARGGATRPKQHAALHELGGEDEKNPQDTTDSVTWDTDQHSDAPGPFGTG
jgi:hypothetical protein